TTASSGGNISATGGATITANGVCWSTTTGPTVLNSKTSDTPVQSGAFTSSLTGLAAGTTYYVRAYATNSAGTAYGSEVSFTTISISVPTLSTTAATGITATTASSGGSISATGGATITANGVCWSTTTGPTVLNSKTSDTPVQSGAFTSSLTGLAAGTTYYVRAYATNSAGTAYGSEVSFTTSAAPSGLPTFSGVGSNNQTSSTTMGFGSILSAGGSAITAEGGGWSTSPNPTLADSTAPSLGLVQTGPYPFNLTGLTPGATYHLRAYATNSAGTAYSNDLTFAAGMPSLSTMPVTATSLTSLSTGGSSGNTAGSTLTAVGVCWSTTANPTVADSKTSDTIPNGNFPPYNFYSNITGLSTGTTYHIRAYASNSYGVSYGDEILYTAGVAGLGSCGLVGVGTDGTAATATSSIINNFGVPISAIGFCYSTTNAKPTLSDSQVSAALVQSGTFTGSLTGLTVGINYYVCAYATNSNGTAYSATTTFMPSIPATVPTVTTTAVSSITRTTASSGGSVTATGGAYVSAVGVCWSTTSGPTVALSTKTSDTSVQSGSYTSSLTGLIAGTTYFVRAYATNSAGTAYGSEVTFTTPALALPTLSTLTANSISNTSAYSGGSTSATGGATITANGVCWSTTTNPTIANKKTTDGSGIGGYASAITGLTSGTTYYVKAYATNSAGTAYGNELTFNTTSVTATLSTAPVTETTTNSAVSGGFISANGGTAVTIRGVCWSTAQMPTISDSKTVDGAGDGSFTSTLKGLIPGATYHVRAYATN
ncbi:MAG: hypothetical protein WCK63_18060, partial [Betaproteobacteria bacterium]